MPPLQCPVACQSQFRKFMLPKFELPPLWARWVHARALRDRNSQLVNAWKCPHTRLFFLRDSNAFCISVFEDSDLRLGAVSVSLKSWRIYEGFRRQNTTLCRADSQKASLSPPKSPRKRRRQPTQLPPPEMVLKKEPSTSPEPIAKVEKPLKQCVF